MSGQHWLVVLPWEDDVEDLLQVEHPDDCPVVDLGEGGLELGCAVEFYVGEYGLGEYFLHVDDKDSPDYGNAERVAPGRHAIEYWELRHPAGPWGSEEWSTGLRLVE